MRASLFEFLKRYPRFFLFLKRAKRQTSDPLFYLLRRVGVRVPYERPRPGHPSRCGQVCC
jgi:hypothetical protein